MTRGGIGYGSDIEWVVDVFVLGRLADIERERFLVYFIIHVDVGGFFHIGGGTDRERQIMVPLAVPGIFSRKCAHGYNKTFPS